MPIASNFRTAYDKVKAPANLMALGSKLGAVIRAYCVAHGIPFDDEEGERFFEQQREGSGEMERAPKRGRCGGCCGAEACNSILELRAS